MNGAPGKRKKKMSNSGEALKHRDNMVRFDIAGAGIKDENVLRAFSTVPREKFVADGTNLSSAYGNYPLSIGFGQTISQPFIVAFMMELLECSKGDRILEIGTGSGYQTALLLEAGMDVVTVELIPELSARAEVVIQEMYPGGKVEFIIADGYNGWEQGAPYDGVIVSAAPLRIPAALEEQLSRDGGKLVIPAGVGQQRIYVITRVGDDLFKDESLPVRFVPLVKSTNDN
ncbi:MAG: protein-L-isoaspartate O-methyltransferase [FCB group bacterium]|nr:protein-L-isoaspartate O-methyltransferase [FCB group bacterium]